MRSVTASDTSLGFSGSGTSSIVKKFSSCISHQCSWIGSVWNSARGSFYVVGWEGEEPWSERQLLRQRKPQLLQDPDLRRPSNSHSEGVTACSALGSNFTLIRSVLCFAQLFSCGCTSSSRSLSQSTLLFLPVTWELLCAVLHILFNLDALLKLFPFQAARASSENPGQACRCYPNIKKDLAPVVQCLH